MKKPKKKKYNPKLREREDMYKLHYNQGRQDMIDFLPSEEEIERIIFNCNSFTWLQEYFRKLRVKLEGFQKDVAKEISKRIGNAKEKTR